jgi:hypothetical protein
MTNQVADGPTNHPETGWGSAPAPAPGTAPPERAARGSRWAGHTFGSTAAVSAGLAWGVLALAVLAVYLLREMTRGLGGFDAVVTILAVGVFVVPLLFAGAIVALATFVASIPLGVAWLRQPDRPAWPGYVLAVGAMPWAGLIAFVLVVLL